MSLALLKEKDDTIARLEKLLAMQAVEYWEPEFRQTMEENFKGQMKELGAALRKTRAQLKAVSARAARAEQQVEQLGESSKTLERELEESRTRIQALEGVELALDTIKEKNDKLSLVVDRLRDNEQALKTERAQLLQEKNNMGTAYAEERTTLEEKCAQLEREKTTLESESAQMAEEKAKLDERCEEVAENNSKLEAERARLREDNARLSANGSQALQAAESTIAELRAAKEAAESRTRKAEAVAERKSTELEKLLAVHGQNLRDFDDMRETMRAQRARLAAYEKQEEAFKEATARVGVMKVQMEALVDREVEASQRYAELLQLKENADAELKSVLAREAQLLEQAESLEKGQVRVRELEEDLVRAKSQITALEADARLAAELAQQKLHDAREDYTRTLLAKDDAWQAKDEELQRAQEHARAFAQQQCSQIAMQLQAARAQLVQAQAHIVSLETQAQNAVPTYQELQASRAQVTNLQNQVYQYGQMLSARDARVANLEIQLQQAQGSAEGSKARRSQDAQTEPILVLRLSKQELEAREGKKDGAVQAKIEDDMALVKRSATDAEIAALVAERDDLRERVKGQVDLHQSMLEQLNAANRTTAVLQSQIDRLHEFRYAAGAQGKPVDSSTAMPTKPTLGPSSVANAEPEAGPSSARPMNSPSPGSKENALPRANAQADQAAHVAPSSSTSTAPDSVFGRAVLQSLRAQPWPNSGHMWLNIMVYPVEEGSVPLHAILEAFVRDSGNAVSGVAFGALVRQWGDRMLPGRVRLVGDTLRGVALHQGTAPKATLVPATPRAALPAATPRSLPTPATAPRPPAPAGPRPPPPAGAARPVVPPSGPRPPPPPVKVKADPDRAAPAKRRAAGGPTDEERPVKRARSGSPAAVSSPAVPSSSPTRHIASSSREPTTLSLTRRAPVPVPTKISDSVPPATTEAEPSSSKPKPKPVKAEPSSQRVRASAQSSSQRAGSSSSAQPAQEPARVDPEHAHDTPWDIEESGMEDLFVLWLRQGILRDISSTVSRSVAVNRATDTLRRRGWIAEDGSFIVPKSSSEYRFARFGQLTIATALGFFDF